MNLSTVRTQLFHLDNVVPSVLAVLPHKKRFDLLEFQETMEGQGLQAHQGLQDLSPTLPLS